MTLRDLLLVLGAVPLLGVIGLRLAAETGLAHTPPPPDAFPASLAVFGVVFVLYVALTLRSIASATRDILARESDTGALRGSQAERRAAVSDFAIHLDRSSEIDLRDAGDEEQSDPDEPIGEPPSEAARSELFGEVGDLLTRIPSARSR
jgi:hypothetical protein